MMGCGDAFFFLFSGQDVALDGIDVSSFFWTVVEGMVHPI
jgi:hypothetical protein